MMSQNNEGEAIKEQLQELAKVVRWLYFDYMLNVDDACFHHFRSKMLDEVLDHLIYRLHDKYADHVEYTRKELDHIRRIFRETHNDEI